MTAVYEIPLTPQPQSLSVALPNGTSVQLRLIYQFNDDDCWLLDIADANSNPLVCGIPLVTGADLLAQYAYLGLGAKLFVTTDADLAEPPHWWNLGTSAHLYIDTTYGTTTRTVHRKLVPGVTTGGGSGSDGGSGLTIGVDIGIGSSEL